jgi:DNA-binding transcriptional ArsR family regulator
MAQTMKPYLPEEIQIAAEHQASFFRVLGNAQRVMILWLIAEQARTANEIALAIGATLTSTGHHPRILDFNNLLEMRREHNNVYYHLADNEITRNCLVLKSKPKEMLMEINLV